MQPSLKEKKKLVPLGKKLDPLELEYISKRRLGPSFRDILSREFKVSKTVICNAFKGKAPYTLYRINEFVNKKAMNK